MGCLRYEQTDIFEFLYDKKEMKDFFKKNMKVLENNLNNGKRRNKKIKKIINFYTLASKNESFTFYKEIKELVDASVFSLELSEEVQKRNFELYKEYKKHENDELFEMDSFLKDERMKKKIEELEILHDMLGEQSEITYQKLDTIEKIVKINNGELIVPLSEKREVVIRF